MAETDERFDGFKLNPAKQAVRIALIYFSLSMTWIFFTDLYHFISTGDQLSDFLFSVIKGCIYSIITGTVLYFVLKRYFTRLQTAVIHLNRSESKYHNLADNIEMGITRRDLNGRCLFVNRSSIEIAEKIPGFLKTASFEGKTPIETYTDPIISNALMNGITKTAAKAKPVTEELAYKDLFLEAKFFPEFDDKNNVVSVIIMVSDRTGQKVQLTKLQESEKFNRSLLNTFPGIVYIYDIVARKNVYSNRTLFEVIGYKKMDLDSPSPVSLEDIIHPDDLSFYNSLGVMKIKKLKDNDHFENTFRMKDSGGKWRWFKSREIVYKRSPAGEVQQMLGTATEITEIMEAESELISNSGYLNAVVEASPMAIFDLDSDGKVASIWNSSAERIFGFTQPEVLGKVLPIVDSSKAEEFRNNLKQNFAGEGMWAKELIRKNKAGNDIHISIYTKPIKDPTGKVVRVLAYNEDLSLRKQFESEISGYSNYLKMLYEAGLCTVGTFDLGEIYATLFKYIAKIVDAGSVVVSSYDERSRTLKCEASCISDNMVDVSFLPLLGLDDPRSGLQSKAILSGESILVKDYINQLENKDKMTFFDEHGSIDRDNNDYALPAAAMVIPLKHNNKIIGALQVFTYEPSGYTEEDLRRIEPLAVLIASAIERERLYATLSRELEEKKKALDEIRKLSKGLEQSPNSIVITDALGNIEYVNPHFTELTGYSVEEVYGKNPRILKSGDTQPGIHEDLWKTITSGEIWHGELLNRKKTGELYWESASIGPIFDEDNKITHYIAVKQDITEKKKRDAELNNSLLEKETMLKEIHHRVKNNLQVVSSLLNMQVEHYSHPEAIEAINTSRNRVKAMALVHENLYRSSNLMRTSMDSYIRMLVKNIYSAYGVPLERIKFTCNSEDFEFGLDTIIPLGLIINETISNSLKHAFPSGRSGDISISLRRYDDPLHKYLLVVKDNGIGLPAEFDAENTASLGMTLITSLATQLEGIAEISNSLGTEVRVMFNELKYKSRV